jgi:hypothetical protein
MCYTDMRGCRTPFILSLVFYADNGGYGYKRITILLRFVSPTESIQLMREEH